LSLPIAFLLHFIKLNSLVTFKYNPPVVQKNGKMVERVLSRDTWKLLYFIFTKLFLPEPFKSTRFNLETKQLDGCRTLTSDVIVAFLGTNTELYCFLMVFVNIRRLLLDPEVIHADKSILFVFIVLFASIGGIINVFLHSCIFQRENFNRCFNTFEQQGIPGKCFSPYSLILLFYFLLHRSRHNISLIQL